MTISHAIDGEFAARDENEIENNKIIFIFKQFASFCMTEIRTH